MDAMKKTIDRMEILTKTPRIKPILMKPITRLPIMQTPQPVIRTL